MNDPIRILHVLNGLGSGGTEAIIMNWYRRIDRSKVQFDFLVRSKDNMYADEIAEYGGRVFVMPPYPHKYLKNKKETTLFFKEHGKEFLGIHVHGNALLYVNIFKIAKKNGIDFRIYHSHNTSTKIMYRPWHIFNRFRIKKLATEYFACSTLAGKWAFNFSQFTVVKNGIDTNRFSYNEAVRKNIRSRLKITNQTVYGNVGRFVPVKNHIFLLETFEKILEKDSNSFLMLIGDGDLDESIKSIAKEKGIFDKIFFLGRQNNIYDFMNAMDVFLLPSLHEGLPIVAIEAQASGLPCLLSNRISCETKITDNVQFLSISDSGLWADSAIKSSHIFRKNVQSEIKQSGYDIFDSAKFIEQCYLSHVNEKNGR